MIETFRSDLRTERDFIEWASRAAYGDFCVYHEGHLSADRVNNKDLDGLANTVALLAVTQFVHSTQARIDEVRGRAYMATRSGRGYVPQGLLSGKITSGDYQFLAAIADKDRGISAVRIIRGLLGEGADQNAIRVLDQLAEKGLVARDTVYGWEVTTEARLLMT
ncbi:MAG: hypothetical protein AAGD43_29840 [Pseudomonadota bacterium]